VLRAQNSVNNLQLARTPMSPAKHSEYSRKHRQRTGPQKERCWTLLTRNFGIVGMKFRQQLTIGQNTDLTCEAFGTFAEAS